MVGRADRTVMEVSYPVIGASASVTVGDGRASVQSLSAPAALAAPRPLLPSKGHSDPVERALGGRRKGNLAPPGSLPPCERSQRAHVGSRGAAVPWEATCGPHTLHTGYVKSRLRVLRAEPRGDDGLPFPRGAPESRRPQSALSTGSECPFDGVRVPSRREGGGEGQRGRVWRAMTRRWIWLVPSKIWVTLASRK